METLLNSRPPAVTMDEETPAASAHCLLVAAKAKPVALRRKSTPDAGMQEENHEWLPYLTDGIGKGCVGRDPMSIPVEVLTASGHPPRRTRELVNAFAKADGGDLPWLGDVQEYKDIRRLSACPASMATMPRSGGVPQFIARSGHTAWARTPTTRSADAIRS